ncbi:MAG: hypothetical protein GWP61_00995 [Chloroflexi bacterium]|jgi:hypothetical protein|nr:hypothetical protein [Chloroflexota bacterium]
MRTARCTETFLHELPSTTTSEVERLGLVRALQGTVKQEFAGAFDSVQWHVETAVIEQLNNLPSLSAGVVYYAAREAIRNAARHGRSSKSERPFILTITAGHPNGNDCISPRGDGEIQIIIGGTLSITSTAGDYTRVPLAFPS